MECSEIKPGIIYRIYCTTDMTPAWLGMFIVIVIVLMAALVGVIWHKCFQRDILPKNFGITIPGRVYRSARLTPSALRSVHYQCGIRTIVDLAGGGDTSPRQRELKMADVLGIERVALSGLGGSGDGAPEVFAKSLGIIADPDRQPVLFHCAAGANRTSTADVYFRHLAMGQPLDRAMAPSRRHDCDLSKREKHLTYIRENLPRIRKAAEQEGWLNRFADCGDAERRAKIPWWRWFTVYLAVRLKKSR